MTEENNENVVEREPFDIQDPSEKRLVADEHPVDEKAEEVVESEAETPEVETEDTPATEEPAKVELGELDQYLDSDLAKAVSGMLGKLQGEIADLKKAAAKSAPPPTHDELFANNSDLFGSDEPSPAQTKNRESIREQMGILKAGYKNEGKKVPAARILFDKALRSEFPEAALDQDRKQVSAKVQNRERKMIPRPTSRHAASSDARERAQEAVAKRMRELGLNP